MFNLKKITFSLVLAIILVGFYFIIFQGLLVETEIGDKKLIERFEQYIQTLDKNSREREFYKETKEDDNYGFRIYDLEDQADEQRVLKSELERRSDKFRQKINEDELERYVLIWYAPTLESGIRGQSLLMIYDKREQKIIDANWS